jgi:hypothetical protein
VRKIGSRFYCFLGSKRLISPPSAILAAIAALLPGDKNARDQVVSGLKWIGLLGTGQATIRVSICLLLLGRGFYFSRTWFPPSYTTFPRTINRSVLTGQLAQPTLLDTLCARLEELMMYEPGEQDMIVLQHRFGVQWQDGAEVNSLIAFLSFFH